MTKVTRRRYDMLVRVQGFCTEHRSIFDGWVKGPELLTALDTYVKEAGTRLVHDSAGRTRVREATTAHSSRSPRNFGKMIPSLMVPT